jgi:two-component system response regulator RegA
MNVALSDPEDRPTLLIVDDDRVFTDVVSRALASRGFSVRVAHDAQNALRNAEEDPPEYALVDLKLPDQSGLKIVSKLVATDPNTRIVVLTGNASVQTAVEAIKLGAIYYLTKPADADDIVTAFHRDRGDDSVSIATPPTPVEQVEWEHIQRVLRDNDGNISATARALSMHRRTLQRKLRRHPTTTA